MLKPLSRDDTSRGLVFSLGYSVEPGSGLVFVRSSHARAAGSTRGTFPEQTRDSLAYVARSVERVGGHAQIVKVRRYMTSGRGHRSAETQMAYEQVFGTALPASTALEMPGSALMGSLVDLEAWAVVPSADLASDVVRVPGEDLVPAAVAVRGDQRLCVDVVRPEPSDRVDAELLSCLSQIMQRFGQHGAGMDDVLKLTVYFRDPRSWPTIEAMVVGMFGSSCPVLNGVVVSNLVTPEGHIELTGWARCDASSNGSSHLGTGTVELKDKLLATTGTAALPIFSGGEAAEMYAKGPPPALEEQVRLAMENQRAVLEAAEASFGDVFRSNWYLSDIRDWEVVEPIARSYFGRELPVPMVVEVSRLVAKQGVRVEPDLWASVSASTGHGR